MSGDLRALKSYLEVKKQRQEKQRRAKAPCGALTRLRENPYFSSLGIMSTQPGLVLIDIEPVFLNDQSALPDDG